MPLPTNFAEQLVKARESQEHCDYEIHCQGTTMKVHKLTIGMQSPVLNTACTGPFKENPEGVYEIQDFTADVVSAAVDYLYSGDYTGPTALTDEDASAHGASAALLFHAKIFTFTDKYLIASLQQHAAGKFRDAAHAMVNIVDLLNAVPAVYGLQGNSIGELRKDLCSILRSRMQTIAHTPYILAAIEVIGSKASDFLVRFMGMVWAEGSGVRRKCGCGSHTPVAV